MLGLAFKPDTDDVRDAPALAVVRRLLDRGAPFARRSDRERSRARGLGDGPAFYDDMYEACADADALLLATEWNEFRALDFARCAELMRGTLIVDGRNVFDPGRCAPRACATRASAASNRREVVQGHPQPVAERCAATSPESRARVRYRAAAGLDRRAAAGA